jgi:hypothetical protein
MISTTTWPNKPSHLPPIDTCKHLRIALDSPSTRAIGMFSFSSSRLFPSWFSPPSKPPNPALSVDNVMDEHTPRHSVEPNPSLSFCGYLAWDMGITMCVCFLRGTERQEWQTFCIFYGRSRDGSESVPRGKPNNWYRRVIILWDGGRFTRT